MEQRLRSGTCLIIATILGLHIALIWLLIVGSHNYRPIPVAATLELIVIPPAQSALSLLPPISGKSTNRALGRARPQTLPAQPAPILPSLYGAAAERAPEADKAIHPPTDWNGELGHAADTAFTRDSVPKPRDFGFPRTAAPPPKPKEFEWDYVATHRVESLPEGGILVHLNDNCVLVLFPLPFAGCGIGKKKANGQLFEHMHDPVPSQSEAAAP